MNSTDDSNPKLTSNCSKFKKKVVDHDMVRVKPSKRYNKKRSFHFQLRHVIRNELFELTRQVVELKRELRETKYALLDVKDANLSIKSSAYTTQELVEDQNIAFTDLKKTVLDNQSQLEAVRQFLQLDNRVPFSDENWEPVGYNYTITSVVEEAGQKHDE
jgi:hypothetical protein